MGFAFTRSFAASALLCGLCIPVTGYSCTRFLYKNAGQAVVTARSMDLFVSDDAKIVVFPRGATRTSAGVSNPISWVSRYGSVGITGFGVATSDGLNEKGLAANLLYLEKTNYGPADSRLALSNAMWAQYVLDNYATVSEALDGLAKLRIAGIRVAGHEWPLHLSIEDASGDSAVIEFIDGKPRIHHGPGFTIMTNEPQLDTQLANLKRYKTFGGTLPLPGDIDPMSRFVRAATFAKMLPKATSEADAVANAVGVLRATAVPVGATDTSGQEDTSDTWQTRWFTVADSSNRVYYFQSASSPSSFWVDLSKLDLKPGSAPVELDAYDTALNGDLTGRFSAKLAGAH